MASPSNLLDLHEHPNKAYSPDTHNVPSIVPVKSLPGNQTLKLPDTFTPIDSYLHELPNSKPIHNERTHNTFFSPTQSSSQKSSQPEITTWLTIPNVQMTIPPEVPPQVPTTPANPSRHTLLPLAHLFLSLTEQKF